MAMFSALFMGCVEENDTHSKPTEAGAGYSRNGAVEFAASSIDERVESEETSHPEGLSEIPVNFLERQTTEKDTILSEDKANELRFIPLGYNERFAYSMQTVRNDEGRGWERMTLYTVRNNDIEDISDLFSWENVEPRGVQFTADHRMCFFLVRDVVRWGFIWTHNLYMANGLTGEVRRLLSDTGPLLRVSKDGRFVSFLGRDRAGESVDIFLFDIASETIVGEFEWRTEWPVSGGWDIFRFDNVFRIYGTWERGQIIAVAELDPETMELRTLWDKTVAERDGDWEFIVSQPTRADDDWNDDVVRQRRDPTIQLQR